MREQVIAILTALGVTGAADDPLLDMVITNVQWRIKNLTNLREVPEGLESMAVSMAVGEYLNMKKANGQLEGFDLEAAVVPSLIRRLKRSCWLPASRIFCSMESKAAPALASSSRASWMDETSTEFPEARCMASKLFSTMFMALCMA